MIKGKILSNFSRHYNDFFSIDEIANSLRLQLVYYVLSIGYILNLNRLRTMNFGAKVSMLRSSFSCPDYLQSCSRWIPFDGLPKSYDYDIFFLIIFFSIGLSIFMAVQKKWNLALFLLLAVLFVDGFIELFLTGNSSFSWVTSFLFFPGLIFIFSENKINNLKLMTVILYVFDGIIKLHESWIAGSYFSSLNLGLPLISNNLIPLFCNIIIFIELVAVWMLLGGRARLKQIVLLCFLIFNVYLCIFWGARLTLVSGALLLTLFWDDDGSFRLSIKPLSLLIFLILILFNIRPYLYKGDFRAHLQGAGLAISMFDANRQSRSRMEILYHDGSSTLREVGSENSHVKSSPYNEWWTAQKFCKSGKVESIKWEYDVALNGGPFRRIVDTTNACHLKYEAFNHNEWINVDGGAIIGYPGYNTYNSRIDTKITLPKIYPAQVIQTTELEGWLKENILIISALYLALSVFSAMIVIFWSYSVKKNHGI